MTQWKWTRRVLVAALFAIGLSGAAVAGLEGLNGPVEVVYDQFRVPTIIAQDEHDVIFMQGYLQASDRFFQMDYQRHLFSGRLAEMVGAPALPTDVQLRTFGLRRAAERSLLIQAPETMAWLEAYSEGVNAWLSDTSNALPIEYGFLELDRNGIEPWTPLDSLTTAKGLAFGLSFDISDINRTLALLNFIGVFGQALGLQLYNVDLYPTRPFDPTLSIPSAKSASGAVAPACAEAADSGSPQGPAPPCDSAAKADDQILPSYLTQPGFRTMLETFRDQAAQVPLLKNALDPDYSRRGSNWWVAAGNLTASGFPMIMNDPHLALDTPATFYEMHLKVTGGINVAGSTFPGAPGVVIGCNETICWGATVNPLDVTDVYNEVLLPLGPNPAQPTHTLFNGAPEPLQFIPQTFLVNGIGDGFPNTLGVAPVPATSGGVTIIVPRRNNGPIVNVTVNLMSPTPITGLSVMYTGWSATRELETFRRFARAQNMADFKAALQFFDVGSQNWSYADTNGNIAYYTSAEIPLREDLQFGLAPAGLIPPYLIRDGTHASAHEWVTLMNPQPQQAVAWEILPFAEMPQIENPASGYILNANNDPIGTTLNNVSWSTFRAGFNGRLYLSPLYDTGYRIGQMQRLWDDQLTSGNPFTVADFMAFQANNQLLDAEVMSPYLLEAFANATAGGADPALAALAADPRVAEAIGRLAAWDFSTPTGIIQGFDPGDNPLAPMPPTQAEIDASVAATIYSVWRGQLIQRVIDGTLAAVPFPLNGFAPPSAQAMVAIKQLLEEYSTQGGTGVSLVNFFTVPGVVDQNVARDLILLGALQKGLDLLASNTFAAAFANSTNLEDYRWGKLHRIVFDHPLGPALSIPPSGILGPALPGFPRAGGMGTIDASSHDARADGLNEFMFGSGPARRFIATMTPTGPEALEVLPGGESGHPGNPHGTDQLGLWLVNAYKPLAITMDQVAATAVDSQDFAPPACGDGELDAGEECDDGNLDNGDLCDQFCQEEELLVELEYFTAAPAKRGVMLRWATTVELNTVGFRVLRASGTREKALELLTPELIPAKGNNLVGAEYVFEDSTAPSGTLVYYLEDVDSFGRTTRHGPVTIERGGRGRLSARR